MNHLLCLSLFMPCFRPSKFRQRSNQSSCLPFPAIRRFEPSQIPKTLIYIIIFDQINTVDFFPLPPCKLKPFPCFFFFTILAKIPPNHHSKCQSFPSPSPSPSS
ncbi:unnamed protein product [Linum tenue]|uniref:Uncharacterized protein n=1 Tax=Linum tenue TaxID=586396 RepID=A0AAV0QBV8_9ROSI|nr:unnamed protein product [Linum tenue]